MEPPGPRARQIESFFRRARVGDGTRRGWWKGGGGQTVPLPPKTPRRLVFRRPSGVDNPPSRPRHARRRPTPRRLPSPLKALPSKAMYPPSINLIPPLYRVAEQCGFTGEAEACGKGRVVADCLAMSREYASRESWAARSRSDLGVFWESRSIM